MWIAHLNSHFEHSLGALVYSDEKVAYIGITQSIKCFLEERNSRTYFFGWRKKDYPKFFFVLNFLANIKMFADLSRSFLKGFKVFLKCPWNRTEKIFKIFFLFFVTFPQNIFWNISKIFLKTLKIYLEFNWNFWKFVKFPRRIP